MRRAIGTPPPPGLAVPGSISPTRAERPAIIVRLIRQHNILPITDQELAQGPLLPDLAYMPIVGMIDGATVRIVDASIPASIRYAIARVAYVAQRSIPSFKTGYDGTVTEDDQRLYILTSGTRATGLVLTALQDRVWQVRWIEDGSLVRISNEPLQIRVHVVARVWVAADMRRRGLGRRLVDCALAHIGESPMNIGWVLPFTESGSALVKDMCPTQLHVSCDPWTLRQNTNLKGPR